ncbi:MAG TPA: hypothetical protein VFL55_19700 [Acetobacteraceae bacterium]|nr:hypothetical protein [Acetobacteraceae bacterium]
MRKPTDADAVIRLNRELCALAERACRESQLLLQRSAIDRIQRCLDVNRSPSEWSLAMAEWTAGLRRLPPGLRDVRHPTRAARAALASISGGKR